MGHFYYSDKRYFQLIFLIIYNNVVCAKGPIFGLFARNLKKNNKKLKTISYKSFVL